MIDSQGQTSVVRTARWVALAMFLIAVVASAALWLSWRDFKYEEETRQALTENVKAIRDSYVTLGSLQRELAENCGKQQKFATN